MGLKLSVGVHVVGECLLVRLLVPLELAELDKEDIEFQLVRKGLGFAGG